MSRGLGVIQRELLAAIDAGAGVWGMWVPIAGKRHEYLPTPDHVFGTEPLQRHLARAKPDERACYDGETPRYRFRPIFSRALHSLIRRGLLVPVRPVLPGDYWRDGIFTPPSDLSAYTFTDTDTTPRLLQDGDDGPVRIIRGRPVRFVRYADSRPVTARLQPVRRTIHVPDRLPG